MALDDVCDDGSAGEDREVFDDDYGGFYGHDDDYYGGYGYDYYGYGDDDDDFLAPVCEKGRIVPTAAAPIPDAPTVECTNTCQWASGLIIVGERRDDAVAATSGLPIATLGQR